MAECHRFYHFVDYSLKFACSCQNQPSDSLLGATLV
jgi:hypothetical protein